MKNYVPDVCLVSPLHDPEGRLSGMIKKHGKKLKSLYYGYVYVKITRETHPDTLKALNTVKIQYSKQTSKSGYTSIGRSYREAIMMGIKTKTRHIHLCDFDRALHWIESFPNELRDIVELLPSNYGLTWIGRTNRAFNTHPKTQQHTEAIVNEIASSKAGLDIDIMSGSFAMDLDTAKTLLKSTKRNDFSLYAEFVMAALKRGIPMYSIVADGLEWETPDQFRDKIRREGYQDWLDEFMSLPEWKRRVELLERNSDVLTE